MSDATRTLVSGRGATVAPALDSLRVTVTAGPDAGLERVVDAEPAVIVGRAQTAAVRLRDDTVSQFHAELAVAEGGVLVTDLGSRNGTHAGGVRILRAVVPSGATLAVGSTVLRVELAGARAATASSAASFGALVGGSPPMRMLYAALERLARTDLSVLITGETGTGKEVAARALHAGGRRARGPFVVLDCTAVPATIAASVLFGHEKGAFTGATERRVGVFEAASGGTIFIDEVGELGAEIQPMLLRVLQSRELVPLGATRPRAVDVRILSATWRDVRAMVNQGTFREDLYYRLAQSTVRLPSLAERVEDVGPLVEHLLARIPPGVQAARGITADALAAIVARHFPGNVRELQSTVERLAMLAEGPVISVAELMFERMLSSARGRVEPPAPASPPTSPPPADAPLEPFKRARQSVVDEFERTYLARLLARFDGNLSRAAQVAGLERHNLRHLLKEHGLYERPARRT